ncbi:MAG: ThiF family adenylyltransferase, partial [Propionicimonas sp.]
SIVTEYLGRLGVGSLVLIDDEVVDVTNLPRLVGARRKDVGKAKVSIAGRNARRANPLIGLTLVQRPVQDPAALRELTRCDWIFLSADSHAARHWVNAVVECYLIPATQLGVRVPVDAHGDVGRVHSVYRRMTPGEGCFWCNGLINASELAIEMAPDIERAAARYVEGVPAASVITLNGITSAQATTDFMFAIAGLSSPDAADHHVEFVRERRALRVRPRRDPDCGWCGDQDSAGERVALAVRTASSAAPRDPTDAAGHS